MSQKLNFTKRDIDALAAPPKGKRAYYYDTKSDGLAISITDRGTKSFLVYRWIKGRPERITLGRYPHLTIEQARGKAHEINAAIANKENPADRMRWQREEPTLGGLFKDFLANRRNRRGAYLSEKTKQNYRYDFDRYLNRIGVRKLGDITEHDIDGIHSRVGKAAPYAANRVLALVSSLYSYAQERKAFKGENPAKSVKKFPEDARERFVQPDEMPRFFAALSQLESDFRDAFLLAILTGVRRNNILSMRKVDVNVERAEWFLPNTKNGTSQTVPLVPEAVEILRQRLSNSAREESDFVFPGVGKSGHLVEPKGAWKRVLAEAGITDLRMHDLRHTVGSALAATGANIALSMQALGHKTAQASLIYQKLHRDPIRDAMQKATTSILDQAGIKQRAPVRRLRGKAS